VLFKKKIARLFIYKTDVWHFSLGLLTGLLSPLSSWTAAVIAMIYLLYQHFEREPAYESVKDTVMFLSGLIIALLIVL